VTSNPLNFLDSSHYARQQREILRTHAEMLAAEAEFNAAKRRVELEELSSDLMTPEQRVRAWEKVHGLKLPRDPNHRILGAIALKTRLTLEQVRAVQLDDAAPRMARAP
jgi:DNA-binding transcriptional regulator YiaG